MLAQNKIRWGILGPGNIANAFATGLQSIPDAEIVAVGSRAKEKADAFADRYNIPHRHASYEALADDPDVDIVYVATPHAMHHPNMRLCLERGKPVLCEKPFTINARETQDVIDLARARDLFLMEGMWTRFFPLMARVREMAAEGVLGEVVMLQADFGFRAGFNPKSRLFAPELGGGALLDVGVYPVSLASMLFGKPDCVTGLAYLGQSGVDELSAILLGYEREKIALLSTAVRATTAQEAMLTGTDGRLRIHAPWWKPDVMTLYKDGKEERIEAPYEGNGFHYEAMEAMKCLREGKKETDILPLSESLAIMKTMDALRTSWGLKYPME